MPRKKQTEPPEAQSERFREAVRELEAAGALDPIAAEKVIENILKPRTLSVDETLTGEGRISNGD